MSESQSRYGIMEQLNSKKIEAQKRLSAIDRELVQQKMSFDNTEANLKKEIKTSEATYEEDHANWVKNQEFKLQQKIAQFELDQMLDTQKHERGVEAALETIKRKVDSYKKEHDNFIESKKTEVTKNVSQFEKWVSIKELEQKAIQKEIEGYDAALTDLKEVSKESTKKE